MAARATLAAHLKPEEWKSDPDCPEQNLLSFEKYLKRFRKWLNITGMTDEREDIVWDMLTMAGGEDMEDLLGQQAQVNMIHQPEIQLDNRAQPPIQGRREIRADTWEVGIEKVRQAINKTNNPVMSRLRLWYEMPQGDNLDQWINKIKKQSERIIWQGYDWKQAALDAICFQTNDSQWRHKILSQKMTLQEAIDWGRTNVHTRVKTKKLETTTGGNGNGNKDKSIGRVTAGCNKCGFDTHRTGKCPAIGKGCYKCGGKDHFGTAPACPGKKPTKPAKPTKAKEEKKKKKKDKKDKKDTSSKDEKKKNNKKKGTICYLIQPKDDGFSSDSEESDRDDSGSETSGRILHEEGIGQCQSRRSSYKKDDLVDVRVTPQKGHEIGQHQVATGLRGQEDPGSGEALPLCGQGQPRPCAAGEHHTVQAVQHGRGGPGHRKMQGHPEKPGRHEARHHHLRGGRGRGVPAGQGRRHGLGYHSPGQDRHQEHRRLHSLTPRNWAGSPPKSRSNLTRRG